VGCGGSGGAWVRRRSSFFAVGFAVVVSPTSLTLPAADF